MHRFYIASQQLKGTRVMLDDREAHHALHVLRLKAREEIEGLWTEVKSLASQPLPAPRRGEGRANV